jgi:hypothetical protein
MYDTGEHEEEDLAGESVLIPLPRPRTAPEEPCTMRERLMLPWASVSEAEGNVLVPEWPAGPRLSALLMLASSSSRGESVGNSELNWQPSIRRFVRDCWN